MAYIALYSRSPVQRKATELPLVDWGSNRRNIVPVGKTSLSASLFEGKFARRNRLALASFAALLHEVKVRKTRKVQTLTATARSKFIWSLRRLRLRALGILMPEPLSRDMGYVVQLSFAKLVSLFNLHVLFVS